MRRIVVDASKRKVGLNLQELVDYRDLFLTLAYRDLRVRYSQTFLGLFWAFLQPALTLSIFILIFGKAINIDTGSTPYPVFAIAGLAGWTFFSFVLNQSGTSIMGAQEMVKKIYFPRLVIPLSKAVVGFVDFFIALLFLMALMIVYELPVSTAIVYLPIFFILVVICALSAGIWLSALTIRYRDFQHVIPFIVQFGLYATPIAYPASIVTSRLPDWANSLYYLNPMTGIVEGFRWSIIGDQPPNELSYISFAVVIILFFSGLLYFKKVERVMADVV